MTEYTDDTKTFTIPLEAASGVVGVNCENSCDLLNHYDTNNDGIIDMVELFDAAEDEADDTISAVESKFVNDAYIAGSINAKCPGCYTGSTTPAPPPPPPESEGDPATVPYQHSLEEGEYAITVTKNNYETVEARINVLSNGDVSCVDVTGGSCGGSGYPRVETVGSSVRVFMDYSGGTASVGGGVCDWIVSLGGWKAITWDDVLAVKYAYLDPTNYSVGFSPVTWNDVLGTKYYYYGIDSNDPTNGNTKTNCGFT